MWFGVECFLSMLEALGLTPTLHKPSVVVYIYNLTERGDRQIRSSRSLLTI